MKIKYKIMHIDTIFSFIYVLIGCENSKDILTLDGRISENINSVCINYEKAKIHLGIIKKEYKSHMTFTQFYGLN